MKKHKQIVIYAEMEGKEITDIQVVRDFDDDETVLLFVLWLCVRWEFPALKPIDSANFKFKTNVDR